jgi:CMP-N-acetylneuraminic acid synthetase
MSARSSGSCLAVIPARGGSQRVPGKNIRNLNGKPTIVYTIEAALQSQLFARVIVSTDDLQIADISRRAGAEIPFMRDPSLADHHTHVSAATADALDRVDARSEHFDCVAQIMACCPLRNSSDIGNSYEQFVTTGADSQVSVTRYTWLNPWGAMRRDDTLHVTPLFPKEESSRSQDLPPLFCIVGAIWWAKASVLRRERTYHITARTGWEIPWQRSLDIDTEDDFRLAEILMANADRLV